MVAGLVGSGASSAAAQEDRPQIMPGERKAPRKKDAGPRALGIIQLGKNGKASIIPVAILINGKFWDASAYKADPVPMALDSGVVYEGERSGSSLGLFTVGSALHSNNPSAAMPWLGTGVWRPNGTEPVETVKKAEAAPAGISGDEGPPRLSRDPNANKPAPPANNSPSSSSTPASRPSSGDEPPRLTKGSSSSDSNPAGAQPSKPSSDSGDGPPRLNRPDSAGSDSGSAQNSPAASQGGQSKPSDPKPNEPKPGDSPANQTKSSDHEKSKESVAASDSGASESNRPRLRRGKPAESFADEEIPGYSLPGVRPKSAQDTGKVVQTAEANKEDVQLIPAISDAGDTAAEPKTFGFEWIPGEEADRRKQMVDLAKDQVRKYVEARTKNSVAANATASKTASKMMSPKMPDPELENLQMVAYDLWGTNQPVLVLSSQAHMPASSAATQADAEMQYSIVLVAYPDIYHNLHKQFVSVTDKFHLDVTPRLDLIDAVDADGNGRGDLLFRETSDQGAGWILYRAGADKLVKAFDSLNPE